MKPVIHYPAIRLAMRALWVVAIGAAWLGTNPRLGAATSTNRLPAQGSEDRFLLIVDTSEAMERNAENTQRAVSQLLSTGLVGQARPGDTIGLWTFSEELQTGVFPLQRWTPQTRQKIVAAAAEFMAKIGYEKKSRFEKVVGTMTSVVKDSERITVIILTDGTGKISGTPFDQQINESYRLNYAGQRKQRMPFITVLRAKRGEFIGWRVNTPPFRPEFPAYPVEPKATEPPVAVTEKKPETQPEPKPEANPATTPSLNVVGETPAPASSTPTNAPATEPTEPAASQTPAAQESPAPTKAEVQPTPPVETPPNQTTATTETPAVVKPADPPKTETQPTATPTVATPPPEVTSKPTTELPPPKSDAPPPAESKQTEPTSTTQTAPETTAIQTAVATPGESLFNRTNLLIAGVVLLGVAFGVVYLLMRRAARPTEKISLITKSMDRDENDPRRL